MAQLVASMSGVVLGGVVEVVGSNLAGGKIFTASIGSVDSLYPSVFIYCLNLHQFLILCSSKAMIYIYIYGSDRRFVTDRHAMKGRERHGTARKTDRPIAGILSLGWAVQQWRN